MIAIICLILGLITLGLNKADAPVVVIPAMPAYAPTNAVVVSEEDEWELYNQEAYYDYVSEFNAVFSAVTTKRAKNGRLMIRSSNGGSFKFVKKESS